MKPIIVDFYPYCRERLPSIRNRREQDLAMGLTAIPRKQRKAEVQKERKVRTPRPKKERPLRLLPGALEMLSSLSPEEQEKMKEFLRG